MSETTICDCDWMEKSPLPACPGCASEPRPYRESVLHYQDQHWHEGCLLQHALGRCADLTGQITALQQQLADAERANADWLRDITEEIAERKRLEQQVLDLTQAIARRSPGTEDAPRS
jgi:hypothetical protein